MRSLLITILFASSIISAQESTTISLDSVTDLTKAEAYLKSNKGKGNKLITFNEEKHKTTLATDLLKLPVGGKKSIENDIEKTTYKVVEKNSITHYRGSYILLDSKKNNIEKTKSIRDKIITDYNNGYPFDFLAKKYSVAKNATRGGDTGWFINGEMDIILEVAITDNTHDLNSIFSYDDPEKNHFYIILKTYLPKEIKEIKVLKTVERLY